MTEISSKPDYGTPIGDVDGKPVYISDLYQDFFDELELRLNDEVLGDQILLASYTVATLPTVTPSPSMIFVSDESGGAVMAFSDGTNWRRCTDRNIVS